MATFLVVLRRSGPAWDASRPMEEQSDWPAHAAFMDGLVETGFLVLGGPLADDHRVAHVVEADSPEAIRATLARDPWSETHLTIDAIEPWTIRLDGRRRTHAAEMQPELWVGDGPAALAFYEQALGAVVEHRVVAPDSSDVIAQLSVAGARFWVSTASAQMRRFSPDAIGGATGRVLLIVDDPEALLS
ncbi:MAG TPA: YciI family protein, partial [Solirubrobacteraceae bacterium]